MLLPARTTVGVLIVMTVLSIPAAVPPSSAAEAANQVAASGPGWKLYRDSMNGFSVRIPPGWLRIAEPPGSQGAELVQVHSPDTPPRALPLGFSLGDASSIRVGPREIINWPLRRALITGPVVFGGPRGLGPTRGRSCRVPARSLAAAAATVQQDPLQTITFIDRNQLFEVTLMLPTSAAPGLANDAYTMLNTLSFLAG